MKKNLVLLLIALFLAVAIPVLSQAILSLKTNSPEGKAYNSGMDKMNANNYAGAIADFTTALKYKPTSPLILNSRGTAYSSIKKWNEAIADFDAATKAYPAYNLPDYGRGYVYYMQGNKDKALVEFSACLKKSSFMPALYYRGQIYKSMGKMKEACQDFKKASGYPPAKNAAKNYGCK